MKRSYDTMNDSSNPNGVVVDDAINFSGNSSGFSGKKEEHPRNPAGVGSFLMLLSELTGDSTNTISDDPIETADFLRKMNENRREKIPVDIDDIERKTAKAQRRTQQLKRQLIKHGLLPNPIGNNGSISSAGEDDQESTEHSQPCKKKPRSPERRRKSMASLIIPPPITRLARQRSNLDYLKNPIQETAPTSITDLDEDEGTSKPTTETTSSAGAAYSKIAEEENTLVFGGGEGRRELVFAKKLTQTDVSTHHQRLLMPRKKVVDDLLLTAEEVEELMMNEGSAVPARLMDFKGRQYEIYVRMQKMRKNRYFTISEPWKDIRDNVGLRPGTTVKLWAFRPPGSTLISFFLDKVAG